MSLKINNYIIKADEEGNTWLFNPSKTPIGKFETLGEARNFLNDHLKDQERLSKNISEYSHVYTGNNVK